MAMTKYHNEPLNVLFEEECLQGNAQETRIDRHISFIRDQMLHPTIDDLAVLEEGTDDRSNSELSLSVDLVRNKMIHW